MSAPQATCRVWVRNHDYGRGSTCGRPVGADGVHCGIHAAAERRKAKNDEARRAAHDSQEAIAQGVRDELQRLGVEGSAHFGRRYTGDAVVTLDELRRITGR